MDALLALRSAQPASASQNARSADGGGTRKEAGQLARIVTVLAAHERSVHALEDRARVVIYLQDAEAQKAIIEVRDAWRKADAKRRDEQADAWKEGESKPPLAALGSQRSIVYAALLERMAAAVPADNKELKVHTDRLHSLRATDVDAQMTLRLCHSIEVVITLTTSAIIECYHNTADVALI